MYHIYKISRPYWFVVYSAVCLVFCAAPCRAQKIPVSKAEIERIGQMIFLNECGGDIKKLVWWNRGEEFPSLGIGHFIWYPKGVEGPFDESFPKLLRFIKDQGTPLPAWIKTLHGGNAPWSSPAALRQDGKRVEEMRQFLATTMSLQTEFIIARFYQSLPRIMQAAAPGRRLHIRQQFNRVAYVPGGLYPLVDYISFKGEGVLETERYKDEGWGLLQVLQEMHGTKRGNEALREFVEAAEVVLRRRVANAPPGRSEQRWLPGWVSRLRTYLPQEE